MGAWLGPTSPLPLPPPPLCGTSHSLLMHLCDRVADVSAGARMSLAEGRTCAVINLLYYCCSLEEREEQKASGHLGVPISAKPKENTMGMQKASFQPQDIVPAMF